MTSPVIELQSLTKKIGSKTIVDGLTFQVMPGEVFGFLGPNGAGKTTTIRMMVGLMSITDGEVKIRGHSVRNEFEQAMVHVGAIVENPEFYGFMSGYQNLVHFARMMPDVGQERIDEVVQLVRLENRIQDKVKTYSLGMRQRLGVARPSCTALQCLCWTSRPMGSTRKESVSCAIICGVWRTRRGLLSLSPAICSPRWS